MFAECSDILNSSELDEAFMLRAVELAKLGQGWVNPNPQVGCVIVDPAGQIIGEGYHGKYGQLHAEREALSSCARNGNDPKGATAYVTLEPCAHTGKTPPCVDALIEAGVARVVVGSRDPNPLVAGKGAKRLRQAGIEVVEDFCRAQCDALNQPFFHFITTGRPLVIAKYACTLDGKISTSTGNSQWITSDEARRQVHIDRARYAAIMVGINTVLADNPMLTARPIAQDSASAHQPVRVVCDTNLRIDPGCLLVQTAREYKTIVTTCVEPSDKVRQLEAAGVCVLECPRNASGSVDLSFVVDYLGKLKLDSVIIEGGATLMGAAFDAQLSNMVQAYIAPKIFGGVGAPSPVAGVGVNEIADAPKVTATSITQLGPDFLFQGKVEYSPQS